ncbi:ATP synthase subunit C [bacterium]|jgi:V/A-type H+/Na+-transporting ATPase subunit K|nr:ATP synthase subunit C [bacterium]
MPDNVLMLLGWIGVFAPMALGAVGSTIGCLRAGQAACGAMLDAESGYGRFVGVSAFPASQTIYGIVVMFALLPVMKTSGAGAAVFGIGVLAGIAIMGSAIGQGLACAAAISAFKSKAEVFGLSIAPAAFIEGFAVFAMIFAIVAANTVGAPAAPPSP